MFGQDCKLEVMSAIAKHGKRDFSLTDLHAAKADTSRYHKALQDLTGAGLIDRLPRVGRVQPYRRNASLVWPWVEEFVGSLEQWKA